EAKQCVQNLHLDILNIPSHNYKFVGSIKPERAKLPDSSPKSTRLIQTECVAAMHGLLIGSTGSACPRGKLWESRNMPRLLVEPPGISRCAGCVDEVIMFFGCGATHSPDKSKRRRSLISGLRQMRQL